MVAITKPYYCIIQLKQRLERLPEQHQVRCYLCLRSVGPGARDLQGGALSPGRVRVGLGQHVSVHLVGALPGGVLAAPALAAAAGRQDAHRRRLDGIPRRHPALGRGLPARAP